MFIVLVYILGCSEQRDLIGSELSNDSSGRALQSSDWAHGQNDRLDRLANDYLFKVVEDEESGEIREQIAGLSEEDADILHEKLRDRMDASEEELKLFDAGYQFTKENGRPMFDFSETDFPEIVRVAYGFDVSEIPVEEGSDSGEAPPPPISCYVPGAVYCSNTSAWSGTLNGASCGSGCTTGNGYDRTGNERCELLGCDYRIRFTDTSVATIDGRTSAADNVILYYGGLIYYTSGSYSYALAGYGASLLYGATGSSVYTYYQVQ